MNMKDLSDPFKNLNVPFRTLRITLNKYLFDQCEHARKNLQLESFGFLGDNDIFYT